jgi:hypothetical protein
MAPRVAKSGGQRYGGNLRIGDHWNAIDDRPDARAWYEEAAETARR